ncbi:hypothetical protein NQ318_006086 [Aromia moschata]|uniref:PiggyBac transposable element-derived protein domain-containing protein n=1 Tax=Aromia moschata TaxID=1265417 RepID=A0AAV8Z458_9CUCU|nr:hypothetical protein NQ318_006086 [Aromia moschata]
MYTFIGILLLSGYLPVPRRRMFWEQQKDMQNILVADALSRDSSSRPVNTKTQRLLIFTFIFVEPFEVSIVLEGPCGVGDVASVAAAGIYSVELEKLIAKVCVSVGSAVSPPFCSLSEGLIKLFPANIDEARLGV